MLTLASGSALIRRAAIVVVALSIRFAAPRNRLMRTQPGNTGVRGTRQSVAAVRVRRTNIDRLTSGDDGHIVDEDPHAAILEVVYRVELEDQTHGLAHKAAQVDLYGNPGLIQTLRDCRLVPHHRSTVGANRHGAYFQLIESWIGFDIKPYPEVEHSRCCTRWDRSRRRSRHARAGAL